MEDVKYDIKYVANYLRKSRGDSEEDLQKHRTVLTELCNKNSFKYVEYAEVGTSDSIDMRPKLSKLLKEVEESIYDAVCVVDYDRLSRGDLGEQDRIKKAFQKSNTLIITPEKIYDLNNDLDDTYADFKGLFARQEYKMITKRLRQGKKIGARRGDWTNGTAPFPYEYQRYKDKFKEKGLVVNDEKLKIYRKIIDMALNGMSTKQISIALNTQKILSPKGGTWGNVTVNRLLVDETHLGKIISNKTQGDGHKNKRPNAKPAIRLPRSEWVIIENCHEAVKTPQEHDIIVKFLDERRKVPTKTRKRSYGLSGLIFCKNCGHRLTFLTNQFGSFVKPCWYTDPYGNKCRNGGIKCGTIEKIIIEEIKKYKLESYNYNEDSNLLIELKAQKEEMEMLILKLNAAIAKINDAFELGDYTRDEWLKRRELRNNELTTAQNELFDLDVKIRNFKSVTEEERQNNIEYFLDNIVNLSTPEERNLLFTSIINKIIWYKHDNSIEMHIQYK